MVRNRPWAIAIIGTLLAAAPALAQEKAVKIRGRVVDQDGKPVAGAAVSAGWVVDPGDEEGKAKKGQFPFTEDVSDAEGRFTARVDFYRPESPLMAIDAARKTGGLVIVPLADAKREVEIRLAPLVRVHGKFASKGLDHPIPWTNVYINTLPGKLRLVENSSTRAEFSALLPPGKYELHAYGTDVTGLLKALTLTPDKPDLDLATLDLPAAFLARHKGKALPPWQIADARGAKKDVTLADYRGKWVLVDFWGYWCGPCVQQLAELIDLYEDHAGERDRFEILAFHDGSVKDLAEMDAKTDQARKSLWRGRKLPFPVLLDAPSGDHGATIAAFGIQSFPTTILIDPEGKLVGEVTPELLEKKLKPIPLPLRISRSLDRDISLSVEGCKLATHLEFFADQAHIPIKLDEAALKAAGIPLEAEVPLTLAGSLSLRSWLNLLLDPLHLEAVPTPDALLVVPARPDRKRDLSEPQKRCAARIEEALGQKVSYDFKAATLAQVAAHFEAKTQENFVLDPAARLDPETEITASAKDVPLGDALRQLLKPLGLVAVVRDEVVLISKAPKP